MEGDGGSLKKARDEPQISQSVHAIRCGLKPQVSRAEAVGTVHLAGVRTESRDFGGRRPSCARWWGRSKNSLPCLRSTWLAFLLATEAECPAREPPVALYKLAEEPSELKNPSRNPTMIGKESVWSCGPVVLFYQTHWLISWTLMIVKRKKRRTSLTLAISVTAMVNDVLIIIILKHMNV